MVEQREMSTGQEVTKVKQVKAGEPFSLSQGETRFELAFYHGKLQGEAKFLPAGTYNLDSPIPVIIPLRQRVKSTIEGRRSALLNVKGTKVNINVEFLHRWKNKKIGRGKPTYDDFGIALILKDEVFIGLPVYSSSTIRFEKWRRTTGGVRGDLIFPSRNKTLEQIKFIIGNDWQINEGLKKI